MNWGAISAIGDMLAAAGVIGSLLFVGMQIRRDRQATTQETGYKRQIAARDTLLTISSSPYMAPILAKVSGGKLMAEIMHLMAEFSLEPEEAIRLNSFYSSVVRQVVATLGMPMSEKERKDAERVLIGALSGPMGGWWEHGKHSLPDDIVADIDRKRAAMSP